MILPQYRVENFADVIVVLLLYLSIESPLDYIDSRTGLLNAFSFQRRMQSGNKGKTSCAALLVNIGNLGTLDGRLGVTMSDLLLTEAAHYLDKINKEVSAYRLERGVFVLVASSDKIELMHSLQNAVIKRFEKSFKTKNYDILLSVKCCLVKIPEDSTNESDLRNIVHLLKQFDSNAVNKIISISDLDISGSSRKIAISNAVKKSLSEGLLSFRYQPVFSSKEKRFSALDVKTLLKENSSSDLNISAEDFYPIAEKNGMALKIFSYSFKQLCIFLSQVNYDKMGLNSIQLLLPVVALLEKDFSSLISDIADTYSIP